MMKQNSQIKTNVHIPPNDNIVSQLLGRVYSVPAEHAIKFHHYNLVIKHNAYSQYIYTYLKKDYFN